MPRPISTCLWLLFGIAAASLSLSAQDEHERPPEPHWEEGRVKITLPSLEMTVAQPNKIPLNLHGFAASRVMSDWKFSEPGLEGASIEDSKELPLQREPDGTSFVEFVPIRMGRLQLRIMVDFKDGGASSDSVEVNVDRLPDAIPQRVIISYTGNTVVYDRKAGTLHFDLSQNRTGSIAAVAFYTGVNSPIPLNPLPPPIRSKVGFTIIPKGNGPSPISLDPVTGEVTAASLGQALIRVTLDGKSAYACADVSKNASEFAEHSNCNDFLPPGVTAQSIDEPLQMPQPVQPQH